jgi:hypothetical protein
VIGVYLIVAWSVLCLIYAGTQPGFSVVAYVAWISGVIAVFLVDSWKETRGRRN